MNRMRLWWVALLAMGLSACGGGGGSCKLSVGGLACKEAVANVAPVARAMGPAEVVTGTVATLDGTASSDANLDPLTYNWVWVSKPSSSAANLSSSTAAQPTFTADMSGTYVLALTVSDGSLLSSPAVVTVMATAANVAPVARAGEDQSVVVGTLVTLDGTNSTDANPGDVITYSWGLSRPAGSSAALDTANVSKPKFTADVPGTYLANLTVSDGKAQSNIASVRVVVSVANAAPVANAGPAQSVVAGMQVTLDGTASSDANLDQITYLWSLIAKPSGSAAALDVATSVRPKFTADLPGTYVWGLVVNDGKVNSATSTVTITAAPVNAAPVANAGAAQNVITGAKVTLNGSGTDANGDTLTYKWALVSKPADSTLTGLTNPNTMTPSFTADKNGTYVLSLQVNDGKVDSNNISYVTITAGAANVAPVANAGLARTVTTGSQVTLDGTGSSDANGDVLIYSWVLTYRPPGSTAALDNSQAAQPKFTATHSGVYVATLVVSDGRLSSNQVTIAITAAP